MVTTKSPLHRTSLATALIVALTPCAALAAPDVVLESYQLSQPSVTYTQPSVSADGRYVAYTLHTTQGKSVYLRDRVAGTEEPVALTQGGAPAAQGGQSAVISRDGRFVLYSSRSPDMGVPVGGGGYFLFDRINRTTEAVVIVAGNKIQGTMYAGISSDGRYVTYRLVDSTSQPVYVRDMLSKTTQVTSATSTFVVSQDDPMFISDDGRYISYQGKPGTTGTICVCVHDRATGGTEVVNVNNAGQSPSSNSLNKHGMSADGSVLVFANNSNNLSAGDANGTYDVFIRDRKAATTERITYGASTWASGEQGVSISGDARFVAFYGYGVSPATIASIGLYQYDRTTKVARRAVMPLAVGAYRPSLSANGRYVVYDFRSLSASNITHLNTADFGVPSGLTLSQKTLTLTEGGAAGTYTAVLDQVPSANVIVNVTPNAQLGVARSQLTFTPANWNVAQTVSVQALQDGVAEAQHDGIVTNTASSTDQSYVGLPAIQVTAHISDALTPTISVPAPIDSPNLLLAGTASPGATVLVTSVNLNGGGIVSVSTIADPQGNWNVALSGIGYGRFELQAEADGIKSAIYTYVNSAPVSQP
ncbi:MAG TPA: hypothetical protein VN089_26715 [Duganella sp.]|nr:hypothetical protein [Duganella sp.]